MSRLTKFSLFGAVIAALCCFTPLLVWILAAIGLAGLIAYLDLVLLPQLGLFVLLALWGLVRDRKAA